MKLNELQQEVHGNRLGAGLAGFKDRMLGRATGQQSTTDRVAQTQFIKNFVGQAASAIQTAINSGLVSPTAAPAQQPAAPAQQPTADPYAAKRAAAAQAAQANMAPAAQPGANAFGQIANQLTPPAQGPGQGAFNNIAKTVTQPVRPSLADRAGGKTRAKIASRKQSHLKENYDVLNAIFESIMEAGEPVTISSYLQRFFTQHMHGVDITDEAAQIKKLCDAAQQTWGRDQGKQALTQLANLGWSISFTNAGKAQSKAAPAADSQSMGGSFMAGMKGQSSIPPETSAASNTDEPETPITSILHQIDQLKKTDKRAYAQLIQQLMP